MTDSPTDRWLAAIPAMPALLGPAGTAERLLLLVHYGIDWRDGWVSGHRGRYWEHVLPDRVVAATFNTATLRRWWCDVAAELESRPRNSDERAETERHLRVDPAPVLTVLRTETEALLLRTRLVADAVRTSRPKGETLT